MKTVGELIEELQNYPKNMKVVITYQEYYKGNISQELTKDVKAVGVLIDNSPISEIVDLNDQPCVKIKGEKTKIAEVLMIKSII